MYLDHVTALRGMLPGLVPPDRELHRSWPPQPFVDNLLTNMQLGDVCHVAQWGPGAAGHSPFWSELILVDEGLRSQYDALRETVVACGAPPWPLACVAIQGTGFHGQHGRPWQVTSGNLHLSAAIPCDLPAPAFAPVLPALPAVAVAEAVQALGGGRWRPGIKWVNDVMLRESKVAGSLTTLRTVNGRITAIVLGVGLNVRWAPSAPDSALSWPATCLSAAPGGAAVSLEAALLAVLQAIAARYTRLANEGPAALLSAYRALSILIGRRVDVWPEQATAGASVTTGEVLAIGSDLSLQLAGVERPVTTGRVTWAAPGT